ncbi:MAG: nucleotidyltransferase family protein [Candidatus Limnocylindria bacterium]
MTEPTRIAAVILAAGASTRFGSPKPLARIGASTMLDTVVSLARDAGLDPIIAVVLPGLAVAADVVPVVNADPGAGVGLSVRLGILAVPEDVAAAVILLGDQPVMPVTVITDLIRARGERPIVASSARGLLAPPVVLERRAFGLVDTVTGDRGLRDFIRRNSQEVTAVEVGQHAPDVDTPADLERLASRRNELP